MSQTQPKVAIRTTSEPLTYRYEVMFDKPVESPAEHQEELYIMRQAKEGDLVNIRINTDGGRMSTVSAVQGIINKSDAHFHAVLEGDASSAGSMIFLLGHTQEVYPLGSMYIHTCQSGMMGHAQEMGSYGKYIEEYSSNVLDFVYKDFLTEEELSNVKTGGVIWLKAPEIEERLEKRQTIREQRLIEESKETYTPEFYAQSVFADILEDCTQFDYSIDEILEMVKGYSDDLSGEDEPTQSQVEVDDDGIALRQFGEGVYLLFISADGIITDFEGFAWESFSEEAGSGVWETRTLKSYADVLGAKYTHNMKMETLAKRLDEKVKEIVDSMQEEK